jgi:cytochrome c-type biogenesis protein CcmH/NrfG
VQYGAKLIHHPWHDDFSEARNVSLAHASGAWILYIDADERLTDTTREEVENLLDGAEEAAFRILLRPMINATPYREYRLWRNDHRIRFVGTIHEKVVPAIHQVAEEDGRDVGHADLKLEHVGYEGDQTRKHHRNLPLLRRQLEVEPENLFAWHHLSRVLTGLGRDEEAEEALTTGVEMARSMSRCDPVASLSYVDLIRARDRRGADCGALLAEARRLFPDNCLLLWMEARYLMAHDDYHTAIDRLDQILSVDWNSQRDWGPAYDKELVAELPLDAKGLCHFRLGNYGHAAAAFDGAARCAPDNRSYRMKCELARARAMRSEHSVPERQSDLHAAGAL